jgi:hypothetical protein
MLDRIFFLHSKINKEECVRIVTTVKGWEIHIDRTDIIKSDDDMLTIFRPSGTITVINPNEIAVACTMKKENRFL